MGHSARRNGDQLSLRRRVHRGQRRFGKCRGFCESTALHSEGGASRQTKRRL